MAGNKPRSLSVIGHLEELRRRVFACLLYVAGGTLAGLAAAKPLVELLKVPARGLITEFVLMKPTDVISVYMRAALAAGLVLAGPLVLREAWLFVKPAVPDGPKVAWWAWIGSAAALFAGGAFFSYQVLAPAALEFLLRLSRELATPFISLNFYISFMVALLGFGGLVFEIPILIALLTRLGLVTPGLLARKWREAGFGLLAAAAVLSPTTDVFNLMFFAVPMLALYAASIGVSALVLRSRKKLPGEEAYTHET